MYFQKAKWRPSPEAQCAETGRRLSRAHACVLYFTSFHHSLHVLFPLFYGSLRVNFSTFCDLVRFGFLPHPFHISLMPFLCPRDCQKCSQTVHIYLSAPFLFYHRGTRVSDGSWQSPQPTPVQPQHRMRTATGCLSTCSHAKKGFQQNTSEKRNLARGGG